MFNCWNPNWWSKKLTILSKIIIVQNVFLSSTFEIAVVEICAYTYCILLARLFGLGLALQCLGYQGIFMWLIFDLLIKLMIWLVLVQELLTI